MTLRRETYSSAAIFTMILCGVLLFGSLARAAGPKPSPNGDRLIILDTTGSWRNHYTLRKPALRDKNGISPSKVGFHTSLPEKGWTKCDFDDSEWHRAPGQPFPPINSSYAVTFRKDVGFTQTDRSSPSLAIIAVRGKFRVTDPRAVKSMSLSLEYRGGIIAYLNGRELARGHLPADGGPEALADDYPMEAFVNAQGKLLVADRGEKNKDNIRRWELRARGLSNVKVPTRLLRKGVNVLAIEVHRASYPKSVINMLSGVKHKQHWGRYIWSTCGLRHVRLTADARGGIVPNTSRPTGRQIWNSNPMKADVDMAWGDPTELLRPVRIVTARRGQFSTKIVVGDSEPIKGISARMSDLKSSSGATLGASTVQIRYAALLGATGEHGISSHYRAGTSRFDGLLDHPPAQVPVRVKPVSRASRALKRPGQPTARFGAVQPIWLTATIGPSVTPGRYVGTLTITSQGRRPAQVPVHIDVSDYFLPKRGEYKTVVDLVHSPESVAMQYGVKLYSKKHFELIARSHKLLAMVGNRTMYIPLICRTNMGNAQSLVRWIDKGSGKYSHDFSALDRYIDIVTANMGRPRIVAIYMYEHHLRGGKIPVTALDPATGETKEILLPRYDKPGAAEMWKPVANHIRKRLAEAGINHALQLGPGNDSPPPKPVADAMMKLFPNARWMRHAHSTRRHIHGYPIGFQALVWSPHWQGGPDDPSRRGWNNKMTTVQFMRSGESVPMTICRLLGEINIMGNQRGFGRIGADFWKVIKTRNRRGRVSAGDLIGRYPESTWNNLEWMTKYMFAAGPDGPISTARYEMMIEGVQECEAIICIDKALMEKKVSGPLAERCRKVLAQRTRATITALHNHDSSGILRLNSSWWSKPSRLGYQWFLGSHWRDRSKQLFDTAALVQQTLK